MFSEITSKGESMTREYAEKRVRWEPLHELSQMKGLGELLGEIAGLVGSPGRSLAGCIRAPQAKIAGCLEAMIEKAA